MQFVKILVAAGGLSVRLLPRRQPRAEDPAFFQALGGVPLSRDNFVEVNDGHDDLVFVDAMMLDIWIYR